MAEIEELGVEVSFDTASWLRQAWTGGSYYCMPNGRMTSYTSIRVPQIGTERTGLKGYRRIQPEAVSELQQFERDTLNALRGYARGESPLNRTIQTVQKFDIALVRNDALKVQLLTQIEPSYARTLQDKPWESCDCSICHSLGMEVVLFRGNNRNRRRGFHNIYTMYHNVLKNREAWTNGRVIEEGKSYTTPESLRAINGKVLVLTSCSKLKSGARVARAKDMYKGRLFELTKRYCETKGFPYFIISAKYALLRPDDVIESYDKVLQTEGDVEVIRPQLEKQLTHVLPHYDLVLVIAGSHYISALKNLIDSRFVFMRSKGYGHLCSIIADAIEEQSSITQFITQSG
jgi:hypothetical protein